MTTLAISDTNILIDLMDTGLLDGFFQLPYRISTTDFVLNELVDPLEKAALQKFVDNEKLFVRRFSAREIDAIGDLSQRSRSNASFTDCSVWLFAKIDSGLLLTGDKKLRNLCEKDSVKVAGILFILDEMLKFNICQATEMVPKLKFLMEKNKRLPIEECRKRIELWSKDE